MSNMYKNVSTNIKGNDSTFCTSCKRYILPSGNSGLKCQICNLSIHTPCFDSQYEEKFLQMFKKNSQQDSEIFSFQLICKLCLKESKLASKTCPLQGSSANDAENCFNGQHLFENDNIVEAILNYLPISDQINLRLLNTVFNRNAVKILSKPSNQSKLRPFSIVPDTEIFAKIVQNSQNIKLFRTILINWRSYNKEPKSRDPIIDLIHFIKPLEIKIKYTGYYHCYHFWTLIRDLLPEICQSVQTLKINKKFDLDLTEQINWPVGLIFPQLRILQSNTTAPQGLFNVLTKNSKNLKNIKIIFVKDFQMLENVQSVENFEIKFSRDCKFLQMSRELLKIKGLELKSLKTSLLPCKGNLWKNFSNIEYSNEFSRFEKFLETQSKFLESLKLEIFLEKFHQIHSEEERNTFRLNFPKMENLKKLDISHFMPNEDAVVQYDADNEVWPIKPINLPQIFPQLNSIQMNYNEYWAQNFDCSFSCETVSEIIIDCWKGESIREIVKIFPKIETCIFLENCDLENILSIYGWSESLKKIVIHFQEYEEYDIFEDFNFQKFVHFPNLREINITGVSDYCAKIQMDPPKPNFYPLNNMENLKKISIRGFKNSEELDEILAIHCPNLSNV